MVKVINCLRLHKLVCIDNTSILIKEANSCKHNAVCRAGFNRVEPIEIKIHIDVAIYLKHFVIHLATTESGLGYKY